MHIRPVTYYFTINNAESDATTLRELHQDKTRIYALVVRNPPPPFLCATLSTALNALREHLASTK